MRTMFLSLFLCLMLVGLVSAQENEPSPYEIALQRIEEARVSRATSLDLRELGLRELPPEIGSLSELTLLSLNINELSILPPEIGNLTNLQTLDLQVNRLSSLPPEIGNLTNLRQLFAYSNQLSSLPPEIGNLHKLMELYIYDNQLKSLPAEVKNLRNLCRLYLDNNQLQYLPVELGQLYLLANYDSCFLGLDGNPLISPPPEVIAQGTAAILDYLRNEAWWHLQRLIAGGASSVGIVAAMVLGLRWRNRRRKGKKKHED
jgi:Leucine-rich repeat (LRR) protein